MGDSESSIVRARPTRSGRRPRLLVVSILAIWSVPNNEAAWWHDRIYDVCMATAGDDDWTCEERLNALPSPAEAPD